jgi:predicted glutamine amidotransferase
MGYVSTQPTTFTHIVGENFAEFASLSSHHGDGWGIATCDANAHPRLIVEPTRADESDLFIQATHEVESDGGLLHLRWATGSLAINEGNTHPFTYEDFSFIHNGAISPPEALDAFIDPLLLALRRGETDSERYFYFVLTQISKYGIEAGITSAVNQIREKCSYSSVNAMFLTPTELFIINEHDDARIPNGQPTDYYDLFYRNSATEILVASSGWEQDGWTPIANHSIVKIDRSSLAMSEHLF